MNSNIEPEYNPLEGELSLGNGYTISWRYLPEVNAREYWSDEVGSVIVWNTALVSEASMLAALMLERVLVGVEMRKKIAEFDAGGVPVDADAAAAEITAEVRALTEAGAHEAPGPKGE